MSLCNARRIHTPNQPPIGKNSRLIVKVDKICAYLEAKTPGSRAKLLRNGGIKAVYLICKIAVVIHFLGQMHKHLPGGISAHKGKKMVVVKPAIFLYVSRAKARAELFKLSRLVAVHKLRVTEIPCSASGNRIADGVDNGYLLLNRSGKAVLGLERVEFSHIFN